jgi:bifunctional non-homologous end joining protein LigD
VAESTNVEVAPFDDAAFVFELKHDGFRAVAYVENGACRLISRKQIQYKGFASLSKTLAGLKVHDAILDGEMVCLDNEGRSQFNILMRRRSHEVLYYVFDCLWLDGVDDEEVLDLLKQWNAAKRRLRN